MELVKGIQSKFMEMTSELSALFKYFEQIHTQFSEKERYKIRLAYRLEDIFSKWSQYKEQMRELETKKERLQKTLEIRSDELIKQKYRQRILVTKIIKLEEMIGSFIGNSNKLLGRQRVLPPGEKLETSDQIITLQDVVQQRKSNVFTQALYFATLKIYNLLHEFLQYSFDFESHLSFLKQMEEWIKQQCKEINTEDKITVEFQLKRLVSMVTDSAKSQQSMVADVEKLKQLPLVEAGDQKWGMIGECLEQMKGAISQKSKLKGNYEKMIKGERLIIERTLKMADPQGKLWEYCSKQKQKLSVENIKCHEEQFEQVMANYVECFKDLLGSENPTHQTSVTTFKMIVLHQNTLMSNLSNDVLRIQGGFSTKKKLIEQDLSQVFNQVYNQIYEKEAMHRSAIARSERMERSRTERDVSINLGAGGLFPELDHRRNKSYIEKDKSLLGQLSDSRLPGLSRKQSHDERKLYLKKPSRKSSIKSVSAEKIRDKSPPPEPQLQPENVIIENPTQQSKISEAHSNLLNYQVLGKKIKESRKNNKVVEVEEEMKKYMSEVANTIQESKKIQSKLNEMLDFVKENFAADSKYLQPFKNLGFTIDSVGKLKLAYEITYQINVLQPTSFIGELSQEISKQQPKPEQKPKQQPKQQQVSRMYVVDYTQTDRVYQCIDAATQTEGAERVSSGVPRELKCEVSPVVSRSIVPVPEGAGVEMGVQAQSQSPEEGSEIFALNQKIKMSTELITKQQVIMGLKQFKDKFLQLQRIHETCKEVREEHEKCPKTTEQLRQQCEKYIQSQKQAEKKYTFELNQKNFLKEQMEALEAENKQRIIREQSFIREVLEGPPPTIDEPISQQLKQKIIALMNKVLSLSKSLADSIEQMELSTMKLADDCENLKNQVCKKLNSTMDAVPKDDLGAAEDDKACKIMVGKDRSARSD